MEYNIGNNNLVLAPDGKTGVRTLHPEYKAFRERWERCRAAMAGQEAIHDGKEKYLPRLKEQSDLDYSAYKKRAYFYNASWRTVAGLVGMMYRKPPKTTLPPKITPYLENIDLAGVPFDQFSQDVATDVMEVGRIGLLVDHPTQPVNDGITVAQAEALGLRPSIKSYECETIINWKFKTIANSTVLCLVVLVEKVPVPTAAAMTKPLPQQKDEFSQDCKLQYRVLSLDEQGFYYQRLYEINDKGEDTLIGAPIYPLMNGAPMTFIPFVFICPDGTDAKVEEPPLIDLVDLNLSHYRTTADYEHGMHFLALPTFYISGYQSTLNPDGTTEKIYLGAQTALLLPDPAAKADYAEVKSDFKALRDALDAKKQEMATLGARMLADTSIRQVETFGATAIKHVAENSILASIAISVSKGLTIALGWFSDWAGASDPELVYDINRDFMPVQMDAPTITALFGAWQGGMLSEPEVFDLMKRGDMIESDKTLEQHQGEIDSAPPPAPPGSTQPGMLGKPTHEDAAQQAADAAKKLNDAVPPPKSGGK
jgi:hypothetical protein